MVEGLLIFAIGYLFGKYTNEIISFCRKIINKYIIKSENTENIQ